MKLKPRGSISGLQRHKEDQRNYSTAAMTNAIAQLRLEKPFAKWAYKEVWSRAGLKSQVSLDSPWNAHLRAEIDAHNSLVNSSISNKPSHKAFSSEEKNTITMLRDELKVMKNQRDQALARIAQFAAETDYYRNQNKEMINTVKRLKDELNSAERRE